ncbi:MAG: hypothetical protein KF760_10195 [Candidatus Eremiobacteraeota bacterium]|nr:hypothetical protein [Candidatus Eremiobacteraeota bacterium]MCW5867698.1 hypothetical protein [Candidatus Eremiobacteraeota bacterium]
MAAEGTPIWAGQLQTALDFWSKGRSDLGGRGLQQVLVQLKGPDFALWRALVYNQLALLSNQMGHWQYAKEQWELAHETWRESGMHAGSAELQDTLDWYFQLLSHYGFGERAETIRQLHADQQPPLLNPWEEPAPKPQLATLSQVPAATPLRLEIPSEADYAPVGGQRVASRSLAEQSFADWDELVRQALKAAGEGKLQPALSNLDKAKELVIGNKHVQALIYSAEALAGFLAGDYSQAAQARQEAVNLWLALEENFSPYAGTVHARYIQALEEAGQAQASRIFAQRHQQMKCPLIDPWADLEGGLKKGEWETASFNILEDWRARVEMALRFHARGNLLEAQKELGLLEQQMSLEQMQQCPGALLCQLQALMAYATGDYDSAQVLFRKAVTQWDALEPRERHDLPYLGQLKELMTTHGLESIAASLGEQLCDPFVFYKAEHQMRQVSTESDEESTDHPREQWETQIREAWEMALKGRWDSARRHAAKAERQAKLLGATDLRVCYSLNSQAVFANAAGDYADSDELYEESVRAWRRGSHLPAARTAYSEFCLLLREAQWAGMAAILEEIWDKPVSRSAFNPALLPVDALSKQAMKILEAVAEEEPDDGVLRLPTLPRAERPKQNGFPIGKVLFILLLLAGLGAGGWYVYRKYLTPPTGQTQKR